MPCVRRQRGGSAWRPCLSVSAEPPSGREASYRYGSDDSEEPVSGSGTLTTVHMPDPSERECAKRGADS